MSLVNIKNENHRKIATLNVVVMDKSTLDVFFKCTNNIILRKIDI